MSNGSLWRIAIRNLWSNKRRTLATFAALVTGFIGLSLLGGYILRVENYLKVASIYINHAGHVSVFHKNGLDQFYFRPRQHLITSSEQKELVKIVSLLQDSIEFTGAYLWGMGIINREQKSVPFLGIGIDPDIELRVREHPLVRQWTPELIRSNSGSSILNTIDNQGSKISITNQIAEFLGIKNADESVQLATRNFWGDLNAVDAFASYRHSTGLAMADDTSLVAPLQLMQSLFDTDGITYLAIYLRPGVSRQEFIKKLQSLINNQNLALEVHGFDDDRISLFYVGTMGFLHIMAGFFVFLIFSAVALSIVNTVTINLIERRRELGVLRAIGYQAHTIAWLQTKESFLLGVMSFTAGLLGTQAIAKVVNHLNIRFSPPGIAGDMQFVLTPDLWLCLAVGFSLLLIVIISTYWVSRRYLRDSVIHLLTA